MKSKILSLFILTTILTLAVVSAADLVFTPNPDSSVQTIPNAIEKIDSSKTTLNFDKQYKDSTNIADDITFTNLTTNDITINTSNVDYNKLKLGTIYTGILTVFNDSANKTYEIKIRPTWCDNGCKGEDILDLEVDIKNKGMGENDDEWYPFDDIEVEITVDNIYDDGDSSTDDDLKDIVIEWGLYDPDKGKFTDIEDEENDFNLKEGKDNTITINFNVNPDDINEKTTDYVFYVKAYAEDSKDDLINKANSAVEYSKPIEIMRDDFMLLNNVDIPDSIPCGEDFEIIGEVWNIATDQEDEVSIRIYNKELGINKIYELGDIDALESSDFIFELNLPKGLEEKLYTLELRVMDEDGDTYESDTDEDSVFLYQLKVKGNCAIDIAPIITAQLDSSTPEAIAGKQVIIKSTILNTGDVETTYAISVYGNSAWSSLTSIEPQSITLDSGESKEVAIILQIDKDVEGDKEFTIKTDYNDKTTEQKVALSITKTEIGFDKIADHLKTNWFIYAIVIVNLILIIAIISVVKRMVSSNPAI